VTDFALTPAAAGVAANAPAPLLRGSCKPNPPALRRLEKAQSPAPQEGSVLTQFTVSEDVERSRRFYTDVLGGEAVRDREPAITRAKPGVAQLASPGDPQLRRLDADHSPYR
jgi:hypothetical protein